MKRMYYPFISAALAIAVFAGPAAAGFKRIKTEVEFRQHVAGKKLVNETGWAQAREDGSLIGKFDSGKFRGKWVWSGRYFCRNGFVGKKELGTDCQKMEIDGSKLRVTRDKGRGQITLWDIK